MVRANEDCPPVVHPHEVCSRCEVITHDWILRDNNHSGEMLVYCLECEDIMASKYGSIMVMAEAEHYGECDSCGQQYELTGDQHCVECGGHDWCCSHEKVGAK